MPAHALVDVEVIVVEVVRRDVQAHVLVDVVVLVKMLVQEHVKADANQVALVD